MKSHEVVKIVMKSWSLTSKPECQNVLPAQIFARKIAVHESFTWEFHMAVSHGSFTRTVQLETWTG